ncbi:hypothetical protein KY285_008891 [Solanum tuberosum]|nr:hypothetical protein KY285_008891 [Solanum tuberosum]
MLEAMQPLQSAIVKPELLKHQDREVKLLVATCICEITRITAPEAPYSDDVLKDIFHLIVSTFSGLGDINSPSFGRRVVILETLARYRSCVVMLDLECDDLINEMFQTFLNVVRDEHQDSILTSMQTIMVVLIEESEDIREDLLHVILSVLGRHKKVVSIAGRRLAMKVIEQCSGKLEPSIKQFLVSSMSGDSRPTTFEIDYHEVIYDIYRCAPQILSGVVPYITGELLTDQLDVRLKAVHLVGDLFALSESAISEAFHPIFLEFLKRLTDRIVEVRMSVLEHVKGCLLSNPFRQEAPQIISALRDRLLDYDENVRKQVVVVLCDAACNALTSMKVDTIKLVAERIRDKSLLVKRYTLERLADIYRIYCLNSSGGSIKGVDYDWIPGRILRCFYDKDFRSDIVEHILCSSLFPNEFSVKDKVKNWVKVFSSFDKVEVRALEKLLEQKQRLQQEMRRYLSLRQMQQDGDATEIQKKVVFCFRIMSRCFTDPGKAEESFQILDQLKDANVWRILTVLLDPNSNSIRASSSRDELLKILGEKHRLYDFLGTLSMKCSYILFNKEHVKEILQETNIQKSAGSTDLILSCTHLLVILARFCPFLLGGIEEDLIHLLEDDNEIIKEGVLHVLAKAGAAIREKLGDSSRSLDLMLERICLEGSRRQAKYAIHALASIMKDDGLKSLSVLYKRLVDMLEEKSHLPAVLQSLGCIAQTAMPVFETREKEIEQFIKKNILELSHTSEGKAKESWEDRSEICSMKIFGIKTLVKSYLPVKDANLRLGIDDLLGILKNILSFGEISIQIKSSSVDKAHLRLAAAKAMLRLSKHWDHKIPVDVFYLTLGTSEASFPQVKKLFLNKVHQYLKDRYLDPKYTCAFLLDLQFQQPDFEEIKSNLSDVIQIYQQGKARQLSVQSEAITPVPYPEYILPYLVHALAHHSSFPNIDECKDVKVFEPTYRQLHVFLSMLVHGDEEGKPEGGISREKESISTIKSILHSIKHSEDVVDSTKSKNSYAVSDLGLAITNRLVPNHDDLKELKASVSLPPSLYKQHEKNEEKDQSLVEVKTWLADEGIMVHFESIKFETNGTLKSEITEDEAMKDSETEGNEVPLGKIMERLKARSKMRKEVKDDSSPAEVRTENDVDILKVVREIDSNNVVDDNKLDASNGHESAVKTKASNKRQKRKTGTDISVPKGAKRQRSSSFSVHKLSSKLKDSIEKEEDLQSMSEDKSSEENVFEPEEPDLLTSSIRKKTSLPPKQKRKATDKNHDDTHEIGMDSREVKKIKGNTEAVNTHMQGNNKSGSHKKSKKKSVSGLAKCTSKDDTTPTVDLIGCRIKIWWPMDKKFYEGVVKSFDTQKSKHVVLYDDGDVEVLRLEKECWELVGGVQKPAKGSNSKKGSGYKKESGERKNRTLAASRQKKETDKMSPLSPVRGKRTPRKNLKYGQKGPSKSSLSRRSLLLGKPLTTSKSKADNLSSGESESEQKESTHRFSLSEHELSDKDDISYSDGKPGADADRLSGMEESEEEECPMENKDEDEPVTPQDSRGSDREISSSHEKPHADGSTEKLNDVAERSDSHGSVRDDADSHSTDQGDSESSSATKSDEELSDDELLSTWKQRAGKSAGGKRLVIRDFKSSDPYVILKLGNQTAKTKVINSCLNPVWNEEFHFSISEHAQVLKLQVFDKDHFKADDKMGNAHLSLQPLVASARLRKILGVTAEGTTLRKVIPESDNCLAADSSINWVNGEVVQDVWLRLCDVDSGDIELKIKLINLPSAAPSNKNPSWKGTTSQRGKKKKLDSAGRRMLRNRRQNGGSPRYTSSPTSSPSGSPRIIVTRSIGGSPTSRHEVGEIDTRSPFQSVKAAVTLFGETGTSGCSPKKATNKPISTFKKSKTAEERVQEKESQLNLALREVDSFKQQIRSTETTKGHALRELQNAKTTLQELTSQLQTLYKSKKAALQETQAANARATQLQVTIADSMQSLRKAKEEAIFHSHLQETNKGIQVLQEQLNNVRASDLDSFTKTTSQLHLTKNTFQDIVAEERSLRSLVDSLQAELYTLKGHNSQFKVKADEAEALAENLRVSLDNSKPKGDAIQQFTCEAVQFLKEAEEMKKKVESIRQEAVTAQVAANEAEERLKLALREAEEAKAAETLASDQIHLTEDGKIKLAVEKYKAFSKKVEEIRNEADIKVAAAMAQVEDITANEKELLMKVEAGLKEKQDMEVATKEALKTTEMAEAAKKAVEGQLRKKSSRKRSWRIF